VEFEVAEYGMIGLQTALSLLLQAGLSAELIVQKLAIAPRQILDVEVPGIAEGQKANLVVFDAGQEWTYTKQNNLSKSYNSPFIDKQLTGKVLLTCNNNQVFKS
jgi:dihydroorotase